MITNKYKNIEKTRTGFTLVEMLVSMAVFLSVVVVAAGAIVNIMSQNRKSQSIKNTIDNVTFAIDDMSRNIRMGTNYVCSTDGSTWGSGLSVNCASGGTYFRFIDQTGTTTYYRYASTSLSTTDGNIQQKICAGSNCDSSVWQSLTAPTSTVNIVNMNFYVMDSGTEGLVHGSRRQPRVIITMVGNVIDTDGTNMPFNLQTTISQRVRQSYFQ